MKIRNGFVSNSSSSSFIIGAGKIVDFEKFNEYILKNNLKIDNSDVFVGTPSDKLLNNSYTFKRNKDYLRAIASVNSEPDVSVKVTDENAKYLLISFGNNEGDGEFYDEDRDDLDYSKVDYDYFPIKQQMWMDIFDNKDIIVDGTVEYGVERNG